MTNDLERDDAALLRLVARTDTSDQVFADDVRFMTWLAERERVRVERHDHRRPAVDVVARGAALMARAHARRLSIRRINGSPPTEPARCIAPAGQVIDVAARERRTPLVSLGVAAGVGRELWDECVDEWVALPDEIGDGRHIALRIVGESMAPVMHTGDTVLVKLEQEPRVNAVIVARQEDDGYVCKRVARVLPDCIELASLEHGRPLIVIPRDASRILGTVLLVWSTTKAAVQHQG